MSHAIRMESELTSRPVPLTRGVSRTDRFGGDIRLAALRVPLAVKLIGANLLVVAILLIAWLSAGGPLNRVVAVTLAGLIALHLGLVLIALRPVRDLEVVASRVWRGDFGARVARSSVADHEVLRVGSMFNILLDSLASDRARMRALATEVIAAGDRERAALARELHDSTAQQVAALLLQLSAAARDADDPPLARRLGAARDAAEGILEEIRQLSHSVHPGVLDDLGLEAALRKLARDSSHGNGIDIDVNVDQGSERLPGNVETALYRVAQEAVRNATRHAAPRRIRINLYRSQPSVTLEIHDDGRGFDLAEADRRREGMGLLSMRERVALIDGSLEIKTAPASGTTVSATAPLGARLQSVH
jgi:signal transduction histidine kinase